MTTVVYETLGYDFGTQGRLFLYSIILGMALGVVLDFFRFTRIFLKGIRTTSSSGGFYDTFMCVLSFFEDILFFFISAVAVSVFSFLLNRGMSRSYILFPTVASFFFYYFTVGRVTVFVFSAVSDILWWILKQFILKVIIPLANLIKRAVCGVYRLTLGRLVALLVRAIRRHNTERLRVSLVKTVSGSIKKKGIIHESGAFFNTGKARHFSCVPVYDSHSCQRSNKT